MRNKFGKIVVHSLLAIFLPASLLLAGSQGDARDLCFRNNLKIIDEFIEPYRNQLGYCESQSECAWERGGTQGVHVNDKVYFKFKSCFQYAHESAESKCSAPSNGVDGIRFPSDKVPLNYTCENRKCVPHYRVHLSANTNAEERKISWRRYRGDTTEDKAEIEKCKADFDNGFKTKLEKYSEKKSSK